MQCQACGTPLPAEAKACPNCGTLTPAYYANSGASAHDPTIPAVSGSSPYAMSAPAPSTQYGSNPSDMSLHSPYTVNPYETPLPPPPQRPGNRIGIIVGVVLLVLLLIGGGVFAWLQYSSASNAAAAAALATTTARAHATVTAAKATATAQSIAVATATAAKDPYPPTSGKLAFDDPLSQAYQWSDYTNNSVGLTCRFSNGAYHLRESKIGAVYTCADQTQFSNFAFEVQMTILHGDCGGMIFRNTGTKYYLFQVCGDGAYDLVVGQTNTPFKVLVNKYAQAITTGYNQLNTIAVVADGSTLDLYVNHMKISSVSDNTATGAGFIGLAAGAYTASTEVAYSNAKVWTL